MKNLLFFFVFICLSNINCSYPANHRFHEENKPDLKNLNSLTINEENLLVLQMTKSQSNIIIDSNNNKTYTDFAYHRFNQVTSDNSSEPVCEETYLYLNEINTEKEGRAIYFITYMILNGGSQRYHLNNKNYIFSGIIKKIEIGYWSKNEKNELSIYFTQQDKASLKSKKLIGFKGSLETSDSKVNKFILKKASTIPTTEKNVDIVSLDVLELDKYLLYLDIDQIFDLGDKDGLEFRRVKKDRKIHICHFEEKGESDKDIETHVCVDSEGNPLTKPDFIEKIYWGKNSTFGYEKICFRTDTNKIFSFKEKKGSKSKKDQKYFSILNIKK